MDIITIIMVAISLSMDAFSLALIYGIQGIKKKDKMIISLIVGIYHFIMPLIGIIIGNLTIQKIRVNSNVIVGIILSFIAIELLLESRKEKKEKLLLSIYGYLLFGLSVSLDSLTVGIGLSTSTSNYLFASLLFAIFSFSFTILGLNIGNTLNIKYGKLSTIVGGIILLILGLIYIIK